MAEFTLPRNSRVTEGRVWPIFALGPPRTCMFIIDRTYCPATP